MTTAAQDAINRTLLGGAFEVIGLGVTGWFVYRYLINGSDRCSFFPNFTVTKLNWRWSVAVLNSVEVCCATVAMEFR